MTLISFHSLATLPCGEVQYQAAPMSSYRASNAFSAAAMASCYSGDRENYITNSELFENAVIFTQYFCIDNNHSVNSPSSVCFNDGDNYYFKSEQFPELFPDYVIAMADVLSGYPLTQDQREGLSEEEQNSLKTQMLICTQHFGRRQIDLLLSSTASTEEKLKALKELKDAGLLILLKEMTTIEEILASNQESPEFIEGLIGALLTEPSAHESVQALVDMYRDLSEQRNNQDGQKLSEQEDQFLTLFDKKLANLLNESNLPRTIHSHLFSQELLDQPALAQIVIEDTSVNGSGDGGGRRPASLAEATYPSCNEIPSISANELNQLKSIFDDRIPNYRENHLNRYEHLLTFLSDGLDYQRFISFLMSDSSLQNMLPVFESYYCHLKEIEKSSSQISSMSKAEANRFFDFIENFDGADSSLSLIPELFKKVDRERQEKILTYLGAPSPNQPALEEWKANSLYSIFQDLKFSPDTSERGELMKQAIASLGTNSGAPAEAMLAQIFRDSPDEETRIDIINAYQNPTYARFGGSLRILFEISALPRSDRKKYASLLRDVANEHFGRNVASGNTQGGASSLQANALQVKEALDVVSLLSTGESLTNSDRGDNNGVVLTSDGTTYELPPNRPYAVTSRVTVSGRNARERDESINNQPNRGSNAQQTTIKDKLIQQGTFSQFENTSVDRDEERQERSEETGSNQDSSIFPQVLGTNQEEFLNGLTNSINPPVNIPEAPKTFVNNIGENNTSAGNFDDAFARSNSALAQGNDFSSQNYRDEDSNDKNSNSNGLSNSNDNNSELLAELKDINEAKDRLKERINRLDAAPSPLSSANSPLNSNTNGPQANIASVNNIGNNGNNSFPSNQDSIGAPAATTRRSSRGPASVADTSPAQVNQSNPYSTGSVLSPYTGEEGQVDNNLIIKVLSDQERILLKEYMTAKDQLNCPELRFIQKFYERNIDKFILTKKRKPWREYAILDLEGMNFRLNYPGVDYMENDIQRECSKLVEGPLEIGEREPGSQDDSAEKQEDVQPAEEEAGLFKSFLYKIGL